MFDKVNWDELFGIESDRSIRYRWGGMIMAEVKTVGSITGTLYFDDRDAFYSQENNAIETYNKTQQKEGLNHWTESCGPTACVNALASMGYFKSNEIIHMNVYVPQPEDLIFLYMNDPRNKDLWQLRKDIPMNSIPGNRVPQFYVKMLDDCFKLKALYSDYLTWKQLIDFVIQGKAVQICLKNPGHYVTIVAYDKDKDELIYNDSFGSRFSDGLGGFNRRFKKADEANFRGYGIVYA